MKIDCCIFSAYLLCRFCSITESHSKMRLFLSFLLKFFLSSSILQTIFQSAKHFATNNIHNTLFIPLCHYASYKLWNILHIKYLIKNINFQTLGIVQEIGELRYKADIRCFNPNVLYGLEIINSGTPTRDNGYDSAGCGEAIVLLSKRLWLRWDCEDGNGKQQYTLLRHYTRRDLHLNQGPIAMKLRLR